jgi:ubiquinone/menaquinone biosynthesis C-methylase UbiE
MDLIKKTRDDYNKIAKYFSDTRTALWSELTQFKPLLKNGQRVLDWGCGNGRLLLLLEGFDIEYYGIDQSKNLIKIAKERNSELVKKGVVNFYCNEKEEKSFPDEYFDLAFMVASFFHLPDELD